VSVILWHPANTRRFGYLLRNVLNNRIHNPTQKPNHFSHLFTFATANNGNLLKANEAVKQNTFFCPVCKTELILHKSGKTGKGLRCPHFTHLLMNLPYRFDKPR